MPVDLKGELTRPMALIMTALAVLGWVLFGLSSWSSASVQKTQRLRIVELGTTNEKISSDLARQASAVQSLAELEAKAAASREEVQRLAQTRSDAQSELSQVQKNLASMRRDLSDADRTLQTQNQKLADIETNAEATGTAAAAAEPAVGRGRRGGRRSFRRGRQSRAFNVRSR